MVNGDQEKIAHFANDRNDNFKDSLMSKAIEFANLKIEIEENDQEVIYTFDGDVDENFRYEEVPKINKKTIVFELENIRNFNSCGIREWIYLIKEICELGDLVFRKCSVTMIDQINMVPDSLGTGKIESFYAPYYCECGGEVNKLIDVEESKEYLVNKLAPEFNCENCGRPLEFDALEESYFLFETNNLSRVG